MSRKAYVFPGRVHPVKRHDRRCASKLMRLPPICTTGKFAWKPGVPASEVCLWLTLSSWTRSRSAFYCACGGILRQTGTRHQRRTCYSYLPDGKNRRMLLIRGVFKEITMKSKIAEAPHSLVPAPGARHAQTTARSAAPYPQLLLLFGRSQPLGGANASPPLQKRTITYCHRLRPIPEAMASRASIKNRAAGGIDSSMLNNNQIMRNHYPYYRQSHRCRRLFSEFRLGLALESR